MLRPILLEISLFLAPFAAYAVFLWATSVGVIDLKSWPVRHLAWLVAVALVLVIGSFVLLTEFSGAPAGSSYVPAHMEDGRIVPGGEK